MHNAQCNITEQKSLLHTVDKAELAARVTTIQELDCDELVRVEGGSLSFGVRFINRGGWICTTFDPMHGLPGSTAPLVPNY
jgi:hypothetical protein